MQTLALKAGLSVVLASATICAFAVPSNGTWTRLTRNCPEDAETAVLLTDGSVLVKSYDNFQHYWKLTPDANFSYQNGTWSRLADAPNGVLYGPTEVMKNGKVFIAGGEYLWNINDNNTCEVYDPVMNRWTTGPDSLYPSIGDTGSVSLADGRIICSNWSNNQTDIFDPVGFTWSNAAPMIQDSGDEESWQLLPDGSVLNVYNVGQRYLPTLNEWIATGPLPNVLVDGLGEIGPLSMLYTGNLFVIGATGHCAIYTPPTTLLGAGSWVAAPDMPASQGGPDVPSCVETNGKVLAIGCTVNQDYNSPPTFWEYDPVANTWASVAAPFGTNGFVSYGYRMLQLPNGQVLMTGAGTTVWLYTPSGTPNNAWRPTLTSAVKQVDGTYVLTGTQLTGLTEGASYGDECTPFTSYPVLYMVNKTTGAYSYPRTYNHSTMEIATGSTPETTTFSLPPSLVAGGYTLWSTANGVRSSNSLDIGVGIQMPTATNENATPGGTVTYNLTSKDWGNPNSNLTSVAVTGLTWVTWNGTSLVISPPLGTVIGDYPIILKCDDNGTPPLSATTSLIIHVTNPALQTAAFAVTHAASGTSAQLVITVSSPAPSGGLSVSLSSSTDRLVCPATATIPEGATTVTVPMAVQTVSSPLRALVKVAYGGKSIYASELLTPH
jgi:hypothetical protein